MNFQHAYLKCIQIYIEKHLNIFLKTVKKILLVELKKVSDLVALKF